MTILNTSIDYQCPIFKVEKREVEFNKGEIQTHWIVVRQPLVEVIALTSDKKVLFNREKRGKDNHFEWEFPGGKIAKFDPTIAELTNQAQLELEEETGYHAKSIQLLKKTELIRNWFERTYYFFVAWDLKECGTNFEIGEEIERHQMTFAEIDTLISRDMIDSGLEIEALKLAKEYFTNNNML
jgi:8-oxo-dGTP pyrophosphatase MutT (NUDIX family)